MNPKTKSSAIPDHERMTKLIELNLFQWSIHSTVQLSISHGSMEGNVGRLTVLLQIMIGITRMKGSNHTVCREINKDNGSDCGKLPSVMGKVR